MTTNPHFETARSWGHAAAMLAFDPLEPRFTAGNSLQALRIYVRDHKQRELEIAGRSLEAHYGAFVLSQAQRGPSKAKQLALSTSYGPIGENVQMAGHNAKAYELGPEVPSDDPDGRNPAVVTWHDGAMHYLIASDRLPVAELTKIASSLYR